MLFESKTNKIQKMRNNYLGYLFPKNVIGPNAATKNPTSISISVVCILLKYKKGNKYSVSLNLSLLSMCILLKYRVVMKNAINKA